MNFHFSHCPLRFQATSPWREKTKMETSLRRSSSAAAEIASAAAKGFRTWGELAASQPLGVIVSASAILSCGVGVVQKQEVSLHSINPSYNRNENFDND